jgi:hypothetical protein
MFGASNISSSLGPGRRSLWMAVVVVCLLLSTAAILVSGTVDGLNVFGRRLPDSTPHFSDPPKERDDDARIVERSTPPAPAPARSSAPAPRVRPNSSTSARSATPAPPPARPPAPAPCAPSGYAAVLDPTTEPVGTALARSLQASDLRARIIELSDAGDGRFARADVDRIMAGDGSPVTSRISEGTLLVAELQVQARQTVIGDVPVAEVGGTMDLTIVRNNCGTITVQRHRNVSGRSMNATVDDGIRGLGEIFEEKIADLVGRSPREQSGYQCVGKAKSKEDALTCLARWEAAALEYHKAAIDFASEIERRDRDASELIKQQLSSLTSRQAHTPPGMSVMSAREQAALYQGSLDRLNAESDQARKAGMDSARLENLGRQTRYLAQALQSLPHADPIETLRRLADERGVLLDGSKDAALQARTQFQSAESLRLTRRAEIDRLRW